MMESQPLQEPTVAAAGAEPAAGAPPAVVSATVLLSLIFLLSPTGVGAGLARLYGLLYLHLQAWPVRDLSFLSGGGGGIAWSLRPPRRSAGASPRPSHPTTNFFCPPTKYASFFFLGARSDGMALGSGTVDLLCCKPATATHPPESSLLSHASPSHNAQPQICVRCITTNPY
jgi:hypothetical protein